MVQRCSRCKKSIKVYAKKLKINYYCQCENKGSIMVQRCSRCKKSIKVYAKKLKINDYCQCENKGS